MLSAGAYHAGDQSSSGGLAASAVLSGFGAASRAEAMTAGDPRCPDARAELVGDFFPQTKTVEFRGALYFTGWDNNRGRLFLKYDGVEAEEVRGRNLESIRALDDFIVFEGQLYFSALHELHGRDLWRFDGTTASLVFDMEPHAFAPGFPVIYQNALYFRGTAPDHYRLYKYEGGRISQVGDMGYPSTTMTVHGGKLLIHGFLSSPESGGLYSFDGQSFELLLRMRNVGRPTTLNDDGDLYFIGSDNPFFSHGPLWKLGADGLQKVGSGSASTHRTIVEYKDSLYYRGDLGELFRFDGTRETVLPSSVGEGDPIVFGDRLFFMGSEGAHRKELFVFDGKDVSLAVVMDASASTPQPDHFVVFKDNLYFAAWQATRRFGFWRYVCR